MSNQCGSYRYDSFDKNFQAQEFDRLYRQASTFLDIERQFWPTSGIVANKKVLDLGCGSGIITHELAQQVYPGQVVGLDISQALLDKGQLAYSEQVNKEHKIDICFQQGSIYALPFSEASFDIVYARLLFQHLDRPLEALKNIFHVLKPGGVVCIVDVDKDWSSLYPEPASSPLLDQAIIEKQLSQGGDPWVGRKLSYYLNSSGFTQVKTTVSLIDSDQLGLANFFGMLAFGKSSKTFDNELADLQKQAQLDVDKLIESPYAWAGFGLFIATGRKEILSLNDVIV